MQLLGPLRQVLIVLGRLLLKQITVEKREVRLEQEFLHPGLLLQALVALGFLLTKWETVVIAGQQLELQALRHGLLVRTLFVQEQEMLLRQVLTVLVHPELCLAQELLYVL